MLLRSLSIAAKKSFGNQIAAMVAGHIRLGGGGELLHILVRVCLVTFCLRPKPCSAVPLSKDSILLAPHTWVTVSGVEVSR